MIVREESANKGETDGDPPLPRTRFTPPTASCAVEECPVQGSVPLYFSSRILDKSLSANAT